MCITYWKNWPPCGREAAGVAPRPPGVDLDPGSCCDLRARAGGADGDGDRGARPPRGPCAHVRPRRRRWRAAFWRAADCSSSPRNSYCGCRSSTTRCCCDPSPYRSAAGNCPPSWSDSTTRSNPPNLQQRHAIIETVFFFFFFHFLSPHSHAQTEGSKTRTHTHTHTGLEIKKSPVT